jgi:hypothetical protein
MLIWHTWLIYMSFSETCLASCCDNEIYLISLVVDADSLQSCDAAPSLDGMLQKQIYISARHAWQAD